MNHPNCQSSLTQQSEKWRLRLFLHHREMTKLKYDRIRCVISLSYHHCIRVVSMQFMYNTIYSISSSCDRPSVVEWLSVCRGANKSQHGRGTCRNSGVSPRWLPALWRSLLMKLWDVSKCLHRASGWHTYCYTAKLKVLIWFKGRSALDYYLQCSTAGRRTSQYLFSLFCF